MNRPDIVIPLADIGRASPECEQALKEWQAALRGAEEKREELALAYRQTPEYAALKRMVSYNCHPTITEEGIRISGSIPSYNGGILWDTKTQVANYYLDPKTLNMLISGKLLTDAEKRKLLARHGVTFDDPLAD